MGKTIIQRIRDIHNFVSTPAGAGAGTLLQAQATEAITKGIGSDAWIEFVSNFASNPDQLKRLKGDDVLITKPWGKIVLAYLPANAMCGTGTTTYTTRNMPPVFKDALDKDLSDEVVPIDSGKKRIDDVDLSEFI